VFAQMFDRQITTQYLNFIKQAGYQYSKDVLGFYFDNGLKKYSIMKNGPLFQCYYNQKNGTGWALKAKSNTMFQFDECLKWILNNIQKGN
jgi:hypothetical protein